MRAGLCLCAAGSLMLAGCGGGSGGGGAAATAVAQTVSVTTNYSGVPLSSSSINSPQSGNVTVARNGTTASATGAINTGTLTYNSVASSPSLGLEVYSATNGGLDTVLALRKSDPNSSLSDAHYGIVLQDTSSTSATIAGVHTGTRTAVSDLPKNVTATYSGGFVGAVSGKSGSGSTTYPQEVLGTSAVTANFGSGAVDGRISNMTVGSQQQALGADIVMNGTMSGNGYTGTASLVNVNGSTPIAPTQTGNMNGAFYGAGATETAGAVAVKATDGVSSVAIAGGFGGKR